MKTVKCIMVIFFAFCLATPAVVLAGNGFMGGKGLIVVEDEPSSDDGGIPDTVVGPENDKKSDQGKLFGDLYKILRYQGTETKLIPNVDADGNAVFNNDGQQDLVSGGIAVGGEPWLSDGYAQYALEISETAYELAAAPYPSQCVQPVADYAKWGNIFEKSGLDFNRLPLVLTYDATWERTECEVNQLIGVPTINTLTGEFTTPECSIDVTENCINKYFIQPYGEWNGVTYCDGVLWTDLIAEVHFGRLNLSRSPEAVMQAAFDEAIAAINSDDTVSISRDAAGRLLLEKNVYSATEVDECGNPELLGTTLKAIDSPLENLALYVKLMKDGHLVTPGDKRAPIDRSERGGIPLWKMLELSDGPSDALRPTVNISSNNPDASLIDIYPNLVDVIESQYYTYYECYTEEDVATPCLCEGVNHDGAPTMVACDNVDSRGLLAVDTCPDPIVNPNAASCEGPWTGIKTDSCPDNDCAAGDDFDFAAAFLAAAADKTGNIGVDMIVYINSILDINQVVGYSAYSDDGSPTADAVDYSKNPVYMNYANVPEYKWLETIGGRGDSGKVTVLQPTDLVNNPPKSWNVVDVDMTVEGNIPFDNLGIGDDGFPNGFEGKFNILGFTQMADDDLSIIKFVHTYQIPGLR